MSIKEYMSFNDLAGVGSSPADVKGKFREIYGSDPDGIAVNHETYYDAVKPAITEQYGHWCYKTLGETNYGEDTLGTPQTAIVGSNEAYNHGDTEAEISLTVTGQWTESQGYSSSITTGMSFDTSFGVEGVFSMGMSFNMSVTAGESHTDTTSKTTSSTVSVKVPPMSKVKVSMVATMQSENLDFSTPIDVNGSWGANFPSPVGGGGGHYFWFVPSGMVLPKTQGMISGTIKGVMAMNVHTEIGKAEPISDAPKSANRALRSKVVPNTYTAKSNYKFIKSK